MSATPRTDAEAHDVICVKHQQLKGPTKDGEKVDAAFARQLEHELHAAKVALLPLVTIANAYDANALDDEARKFYGVNNEHETTTPHDKIELYNGRGGKKLLTLADCMKAREIVCKDS